MAEDNKFSMNMNLLQHFDAAVEDEDASLKDSDRYVELTCLTKKYSEGSPLNEGGMKKIVHCRDLFTDRDVAMAVPKDDLDGEGIDRFIEEARITASLEHPNIVPVHELSVDEGRPFFTMKILGGENLGEVIKKMNQAEYKERYTSQYMLEIFLKICDAIAFAHSKGILHLDVKPSNIQINYYGYVVVCVWGVACYLDKKSHDSKKIIGTPGYMSPELINGEQVTERSDIFSLGALLYTMLLHKMAFSGAENETVKKHVLEGEMQEPAELPASLKAVVLKALSTKEEDRYKECSEMADDIRAYLNGFATSAEDAGFLTQFMLMVKRYKVLSATIISFILIIGLITSSFIVHLNAEKKIAILAKDEAEKSRDEADKARKEAEESRDLANKAKEDSMQVRKSAAPNFVKYARREYSETDFERAYRLTKKAMELDPESHNAKRFMVNLLMGRREFDEALQLINSLDNKAEFDERIEFIKFCQDLKQKGPLIEQQPLVPKFVDLRYIKGAPGLRMHLLYSLTFDYSLEQRLDFAKRYLKSITVIKKFRFDLSYEGENMLLSLAGNVGMYSIVSLHNLPIIELDVSNTSVHDLRALSNMKLRKLNLEGTDVLDLGPLANCPLQELSIYKTNVKHLEKLENTPLEVLTLNNRWVDISELEGFKKLRKLNIPRGFLPEKEIKTLREKYEVVEF
ncbi:MAG: protein kinase [Lentisphaerales bacterium]|nr:protein kinase [Lentisphaerales bacterium]